MEKTENDLIKEGGHELVSILIKLTKENEKLTEALQTIFLNTVNRDFNGDWVYKGSVISNIEMVVGKKKCEEWKNFYL